MRRWATSTLVALVAFVLAGCSLLPAGSTTSQVTPTPTTALAPEPPAGWRGGTVEVADLPAEAVDTLLLIAEGGPFPYDQDGATFQNREGILPAHPRGYYREYTVATPGSPDRGARRVVTGDDGEHYYTDDHYDSFRFIVGEPAG